MSDTQSTNNEEQNVESAENIEASAEPKVVDPLVEEWKSKAAYLAAELDNIKKRSIRERAETIKFANESLLRLVIPVLDNFTLALDSAKGAKEAESADKMLKALIEGLDMTFKHFESTLAQAGVEFIQAKGESFDPEIHEAVGQLQDASQGDGVILQEVQRGYKLGGRVARTAKVIVNKIAN